MIQIDKNDADLDRIVEKCKIAITSCEAVDCEECNQIALKIRTAILEYSQQHDWQTKPLPRPKSRKGAK